ncbi:phosphonate metabolism protein/1,5-bisphosphokinase (PRPP-forming) PhnN [Pseudomonas benzenivorans]|uniref:Ribose 1,5-bisphosphate phosphokinase PhnN n=1 Tax=Pseudomonas benzenivorans TaxID=556533 RepID=A0ABY5H762_9PSED|nr:phosphonate metabolism protein/1,5-bisphosphokinase (PRPP-forming) PhnN [Pseudomonas benzenivorans]UTW07264.1 phosphonate metabolism protein/1,5-bisphosphokinase (PRPP-forming) PhnN [Pseudomonas benzenivorans]
MGGRLIYLMGPSGAGKDSLLDAARERLAARGCLVARRVITRSAQALGEDAVALSPEAFAERERAGDFAMSWYANGLAYGIPRQIDDWLGAGRDVLVNGSRGYLEAARRRYPELLAVLLTVEPEVLHQRLLRRGRETPEQIAARLRRSAQFAGAAFVAERLHLLDNSGDLGQAVECLFGLLGYPEATPEGASPAPVEPAA